MCVLYNSYPHFWLKIIMIKFGMKKFIRLGILIIFFGIIFTSAVAAANYEINNFHSQIELNQDSSLTVKEKIEVKFLIAQHGIYRVIPYIYKNNKKTIIAKIEILGVKSENGVNIPYTIDNYNQSKRVKIGDPNMTVFGIRNYIIEYKIRNVVLDYGNGPEVYWNVTGSEWESPITKASAMFISPFGKITKTECFGCASGYSDREANFDGKGGLTIVIQIDKNNQIKMAGKTEKLIGFILNNWGYLISIMPVTIMFIFWYKKGRDKKYLTDNIYYKPEDKTEKSVPLLNRPHLPLVYSPIDGLSPAEVGTIIDERVDTKDIVAEIVELARLGYLTIKKIEKKKFLGLGSDDYELIRSEKKTEILNKFQDNLLKDLFDDKEKVIISDLKNHFYTHLNDLKNDLYEILVEKKMADKNFGTVKVIWVSLFFIINGIAFVLLSIFISQTSNFGPMIVLIIGFIPSLILAFNMPRKTAWGYSLHRQAVGLKYYLSKGKWREEIAEKNLFLEEMLPLAISLGVVSKLAADMKDLGLEPPKYFQGMVISSFANDLNSFNSAAVSGLTMSPSGTSSWSGGSGFSGGGGGGGFGGGGGGSW